MSRSLADIHARTRFDFGKNWLSFIEIVDEARIRSARDSLLEALHVSTLSGRTFLDVGCGSGLFSLAACQLGARVRSFDCDPESILAATELRRRFAVDSDWIIEQGSILDPQFVADLGRFDIVYSWGVLHHTGELWRAMDATARLVTPGGLLYVSVYNDQGFMSRVWRRVKRRYNTSGRLMRVILVASSAAYLWPLPALRQVILRSDDAIASLRSARGMSRKHDLIDWVGGYPFEVAKPDEVFTFVHRLGFELRRLRTARIGCNEYVFQAPPSAQLADWGQRRVEHGFRAGPLPGPASAPGKADHRH
jgi:2-polyprenyl-3-methyl-5-hydroxy-6-metoxy-1,4-benzoquinol methylase